MSIASEEVHSSKLPASESVSVSNVNFYRNSYDDRDTVRFNSDANSLVIGDPEDYAVVRRKSDRNGSMENLVNFSANVSSNRSSRAADGTDNGQTGSSDIAMEQDGNEYAQHLNYSASTIHEGDEDKASVTQVSVANSFEATSVSMSSERFAGTSYAYSIETGDRVDSLTNGSPQVDGPDREPNIIDEFSAEEEYALRRRFRRVTVCGLERSVDLDLIEPYRSIVQHGGYIDSNCAVITLSVDCIPPRSTPNYDQLMEDLFFYVLSSLEQIIVDSYILVVVNSASLSSNSKSQVELPGINWLRTHHALIDRRLRKSVKLAVLVNASFRVRTIITLVSFFVSPKLNKKIHYVRTADELSRLVPLECVHLPKEFLKTAGRGSGTGNSRLQQVMVASQLARHESVETQGQATACEDRRSSVLF